MRTARKCQSKKPRGWRIVSEIDLSQNTYRWSLSFAENFSLESTSILF